MGLCFISNKKMQSVGYGDYELTTLSQYLLQKTLLSATVFANRHESQQASTLTFPCLVSKA